MGRRSAFVQPKVVRLYLADVRRRALDTLKQQTVFPDTSLPRRATEAELSAAQQALADAEEDGYFIDVKGELNAGETRRVFSQLVRDGGFVAGEKPVLDPQQVGITKMLQYVVGWNMAGQDGLTVPFSEAAVNNLRQDIYADIVAAVDWHEENVERERTARKNDQGTSKESGATSASPSDAVGASSGSAN